MMQPHSGNMPEGAQLLDVIAELGCNISKLSKLTAEQRVRATGRN
jgi:hypothetical protein